MTRHDLAEAGSVQAKATLGRLTAEAYQRNPKMFLVACYYFYLDRQLGSERGGEHDFSCDEETELSRGRYVSL